MNQEMNNLHPSELIKNPELIKTPEQINSNEIAVEVDKGIKEVLQKATNYSAISAGSILTMAMAKNNPSKIKNLVAINFNKITVDSLTLKQIRLQRYIQAMKNFGKQEDQINLNDSGIKIKQKETIKPQIDQKLIEALVNIISGANLPQLPQQEQQQYIEYSHYHFLNYIINITKTISEESAVRLYAVNHFSDLSIFEQFPDLQNKLMASYSRFVALIQKKL